MRKFWSIFKPNVANILLAFFFISWQYLSFYEELGQVILQDTARYLLSGLKFIRWDDVFVRSSSLLLLWVLIAILIYLAFLGIEALTVYFHNISIKRKMSDVGENLELLRKRKVRTLEAHFAFLGAIIMFVILLNLMVPYLESVRSLRLDLYLFGLQEQGYYPDFNNLGWKIISFGVCFPIWYLLASLNVWLISFSKKRKGGGRDFRRTLCRSGG